MRPIYDNAKAIDFIEKNLPSDIRSKITMDDINYIISLMFDYYNDITAAEEDIIDEETIIEISEAEILTYILRENKKNKSTDLSSNEISFIIQGELAYCDSLGIFE